MRNQVSSELQRKTARVRPSLRVGHRLREGEDGTEKLCARCDDWWPATPEYFFRAVAGEGGLFYCCKACFADWRRTRPRKSQARLAE